MNHQILWELQPIELGYVRDILKLTLLSLYVLDKISFIDHEYAMFNYQPFDIGNHFCEYAGKVLEKCRGSIEKELKAYNIQYVPYHIKDIWYFGYNRCFVIYTVSLQKEETILNVCWEHHQDNILRTNLKKKQNKTKLHIEKQTL